MEPKERKEVVQMQPKKANDQFPARYAAEFSVSGVAGKPPEKTTSKADIDMQTNEDGEVLMDVMFDEVEGGYRQSVTIKLDARGARELAYSLLLQAND
jgi:hypothetical protein